MSVYYIQWGFNIKFYKVFAKFFQKQQILVLPANLFHNKRLESIAFADVVELFDADTAHYSLPQVGEGGPQLLATVVDEDATSA